MTNKKRIIIVIIGWTITILCLFMLVQFVHANSDNADYCDQGKYINNPHCTTITPTKKPCLTPSPTIALSDTPTASPTAELSDTPTAGVSATPTLTPTEQPTATPTSTPSTSNTGNSGNVSTTTQVAAQVTLPPCTPSTCGWK